MALLLKLSGWKMDKIKVLIVEDEAIVALDIKMTILKLGFKVTNCVTNYDDALHSVKTNSPDIILMDINLKNSKNGIETAKSIQKSKNIPIIYLTAYSDENTINKAIETNPISYLLKPFKREDLKSTILLGIYKVHNTNKSIIHDKCVNIGFDYYYDLYNETLYYKTAPVRLSLNERKLMTILVEAKGAIVSFREIEYLIWPDTAVSDSALRTLLYRLRAKLEYKIIETIPSTGCKLTPFL